MVSMGNFNKDKITGKDCFDFINDTLFNPISRGFKLLSYSQGFEIPENKQIWSSFVKKGQLILLFL